MARTKKAARKSTNKIQKQEINDEIKKRKENDSSDEVEQEEQKKQKTEEKTNEKIHISYIKIHKLIQKASEKVKSFNPEVMVSCLIVANY